MANSYSELVARAEKLIDIDRHNEAIPVLTKALSLEPESFEAAGLMAYCYLSLNRLEDALKFADKTIQAEPECEWGHRLKSLVMTELGWHREAMRSAEEAARLAPNDPLVLNTLVNTYIQLKKIKQAREAAGKMLEEAPDMELSHFTMGNTYLAAGDHWSAEQSFREALHINPNSSQARNNLGVALQRQELSNGGTIFSSRPISILPKERGEQAEDHFYQALKIAPDNDLAAENLKYHYSYVSPIAPLFAYLPFMMITFYVIPFGSIIAYIASFVVAVRSILEVRRKRQELTQEMLDFVRSRPYFTEGGVLEEFGDLMWISIEKTWKPHLLALTALFLTILKWKVFPDDPVWLVILSLLAVAMAIGSFFWLAHDSRK